MTNERNRRKIDAIARLWLLRLARRGALGYTLTEMTGAVGFRSLLPSGREERILCLLRALDRLNADAPDDTDSAEPDSDAPDATNSGDSDAP